MYRNDDIAFVLGTRPEMVKLSPVAARLGARARIIHTGQHYDSTLSEQVWSDLGLTRAERVLDVGGLSRAEQIGRATTQLGDYFSQERPAAVVVHGDTNATLAGALAANAHGIPLVHIEAGLRSFDRAMPEEHNRVVVDHLADLLCAPTEVNRANLLAERIESDRIIVTGNTVVEAVHQALPPQASRHALLRSFSLNPAGYVLATIHRPENTDARATLLTILSELLQLDAPVVLPLHPRTRARIEQFGLSTMLDGLTVIQPQRPSDFLALAAEAAALISDSGGLQEECSVIKRPLLVVRASTERPEVMGVFAERVEPSDRIAVTVNRWLADIRAIHEELAGVASPYGDGRSAELIADAILALVAPRPVRAARHSATNTSLTPTPTPTLTLTPEG